MPRERTFAPHDVFPAAYTTALGDELGSYVDAAFVVTIKPSDPAVLRVVAGDNNDRRAIAVEGRWRWLDATIESGGPGGGAARWMDVYVTGSENVYTPSSPGEVDNTLRAPGLAIVETGAAPTGVVLKRRVAQAWWDGAKFTTVDMFVGPASGTARHASDHYDDGVTAGRDALRGPFRLDGQVGWRAPVVGPAIFSRQAAGLPVVANLYNSGDAQYSFVLNGDGRRELGAGGATARDVHEYRSGPGVLRLDETHHVGQDVRADGALRAAYGTSALVVAGAQGPAAEAGFRLGGAGDVNLYRQGPDVLRTDDNFSIGTSLTVAGMATFVGAASGPTAALDTNTGQLASTAFVLGQASSVVPAMDGTATAGVLSRWARGDHVHPTDTSRAGLALANVFTNTQTIRAATGAAALLLDATTTPQQSYVQFASAGVVKWQVGRQTDNSFYIYDVANVRNALTISTAGDVALNLSGGNPLAPTQPQDTNSQRIATTAYVLAQAFTGSPAMDGVASSGASTRWARGDHAHPTDTSRAPLVSPALVGTPTVPTAAVDTNTGQAASTAFVLAQAASTLPLGNGVATAGAVTRFARADHVHPVDTSRQAADATLAAFAAFNANGLLTQTAADTFTARAIAGAAGRIAVTNGSGVAGNPTIDIDAGYAGQNTITTLGTITAGVWSAGAVAATGAVSSTGGLTVSAPVSRALTSQQTAANAIVSNFLIGGDVNPAFRILGDGTIAWGSGGGSAPDINLYRNPSGPRLQTDDQMDSQRSFTSDVGFSVRVATDSVARGIWRADGRLGWGPGGSAGQDVFLYRPIADMLRTDSQFDSQRINATDIAFSTRRSTDTVAPFIVQADGKLGWGDGTGVRDVFLSRSGGNLWVQAASLLTPPVVVNGTVTSNGMTVGGSGLVLSGGFTVSAGGADVTGGSTLRGTTDMTGALKHSGASAGFYGKPTIARPHVAGTRSGASADTNLLNALDQLGLIVNDTAAP